jgi:uncharacterized membrane protein YbhN (UPF0104 family)
LIGIAALLLAVFGVLYALLPAVAGLDDTWQRLDDGDPAWLFGAGGLEILSFASYMVLFRTVCADDTDLIDLRQSYLITMAGVAATRLLAVAGAGGIALTAWALRRLGMSRRETTARIGTFLVLLYGIFMATLVIGGAGLRSGLLPGPAPFGLTVVPALFGAAVIAVALALGTWGRGVASAADRFGAANRRIARWARALAVVPATVASGVRGSLRLLRDGRPGLAGALGWWGFDVAVLWACLEAFGGAPTPAVVVMAYFVGMLANTLPVPGGIGAVDGGMTAALIGFGVDGGLALVAVLSYRAFAFWLPTAPGVVAYLQILAQPRLARGGAAP